MVGTAVIFGNAGAMPYIELECLCEHEF